MGSKRGTKVVERSLPTNQNNDTLLGCKVLKKVPLCQVEDLVERRGLGRALSGRKYFGSAGERSGSLLSRRSGSVEVLEELDAE